MIFDDGPAVPDQEHERNFEPGVRGRAADSNGKAGAGLALVRRLARSVEVDVQAAPLTAGGLFLVRLPAG